MKKVNVFIDDNDSLNVSVSKNYKDGSELFSRKGDNALNYLSLFKSDKLLNVIETTDDIDVTFEYADYSMELRNYSNFLTHEKYKDVSSLQLLKKTVTILSDAGYRVFNADITIVAQKPKLLPYIPDMIHQVASVLGISSDCVSIKATTTEKLGFEGRMEGISSYAVCTVVEL